MTKETNSKLKVIALPLKIIIQAFWVHKYFWNYFILL